jgi:hypothetical protein
MAANLEDVPSMELMTELLRRMKCSSKPDKRVILVGNARLFLLPLSLSLSVVWFVGWWIRFGGACCPGREMGKDCCGLLGMLR